MAASSSISATWATRLLRDFPCSIPIIGAPMAGVSGGSLAAEVCRAGGLGFIAMGDLPDEASFQVELELFRRHGSRSGDKPQYPLCLGFIGFMAFADDAAWKRLDFVLKNHKPAVVQFFAPSLAEIPTRLRHDLQTQCTNNVELAQSYSAKVMAQVGSYQEAREALEAGVDGIIVQGSEAGGHGLRRELGSSTLSLATSVVPLAEPFNVPVVAAGGIVNGRGLAAALALGCDGAVLGTRLWASEEALGHDEYKQRLVDTVSCDQVIRTTVFDQIHNSYLKIPWPRPFDSVGAIRNDTTAEWDGRPDELATAIIGETEDAAVDSLFIQAYRQAQKDRNVKVARVLAGQSVGLVEKVEPAYDIVTRVSQEAIDCVQNMSKLLLG